MRILICYAGKTGTTNKCVDLLKEKIIKENVDYIDLNDNLMPSVDDYDAVILGGSIRMGMLHKKVKGFIENNKEALLNKKVGIFIVCGFAENKDKMVNNNFDKELLDHAFMVECFGGELALDKIKGGDKLITKMVLKASEKENKPLPKIIYENIDNMANKINEL